MASALKNLSSHRALTLNGASTVRVCVVVSEWNHKITGALSRGAVSTLLDHGIKEKNIFVHTVPGSFELTLGASLVNQKYKPDAVICLGCVITGETRHAEYICNAVAQGLTILSLQHQIPFIFGVLTPDTQKQAEERSGGKHGNKGIEAAMTALELIKLKKSL